MTLEEQVRADLAHYGHVVDRLRALRELHPPLDRIVQESRAGRRAGPQSLEAA